MLRWGNSELIVEAVMPDLFFFFSVVDNTVLDGVSELEDSLFGLGLFTDIGVLVHAHHDVLILGATDD